MRSAAENEQDLDIQQVIDVVVLMSPRYRALLSRKEIVMIAKIISPICLFLVLSLVPTLVAAGSIEVTLTYDGPG